MEQKANEVASDVELVTVVSPRTFSVMLEHGKLFPFTVGAQDVPAEVAEHWYVKAHGVTVYTPVAAKKSESESNGESDGDQGDGGNAETDLATGGTGTAPEKRRAGRPPKQQS